MVTKILKSVPDPPHVALSERTPELRFECCDLIRIVLLKCRVILGLLLLSALGGQRLVIRRRVTVSLLSGELLPVADLLRPRRILLWRHLLVGLLVELGASLSGHRRLVRRQRFR